jgi:hypothetical protein
MFSLAAQQHLVNEKGEAPSELLSNASGDLGDHSHDTAVDAQGYALSSARSALHNLLSSNIGLVGSE